MREATGGEHCDEHSRHAHADNSPGSVLESVSPHNTICVDQCGIAQLLQHCLASVHLPPDSVPTSSDIHRIFDSLDVKIATDKDVLRLSAAKQGATPRITPKPNNYKAPPPNHLRLSEEDRLRSENWAIKKQIDVLVSGILSISKGQP